MVIDKQSARIDGTVYTVRVSNLRRRETGIAAIDVGVKREGDGAIIRDNTIQFSSLTGTSLPQSLPTPSGGGFRTKTVYLPTAAQSVTATWVGEYGNRTAQTELTFSGIGGEEITPCSFTNSDGTVPSTASDSESMRTKIKRAARAGAIPQDAAAEVGRAIFTGEIYEPCVGSASVGDSGGRNQEPQGISPTAIGLGVLGLGTVAVVLSQRD